MPASAQQSAESGEELKKQAEQVRQAVAELLRMAQGGDGGAVNHVAEVPRRTLTLALRRLVATVTKPVTPGTCRRETAHDDLSFKDV